MSSCRYKAFGCNVMSMAATSQQKITCREVLAEQHVEKLGWETCKIRDLKKKVSNVQKPNKKTDVIPMTH